MIGICQSWPRVQGLEALLGEPVAYRPFRHRNFARLAVLGNHVSAAGAIRLATRLGLPWFRVGSGFLSFSPSEGRARPLSIVIDDVGIYDDARAASRLEQLAQTFHSRVQNERARKLMELWRRGGISQFGMKREESPMLPNNYVLVIDEPMNRRFTTNALADASTFEHMLETALAEHPNCTILIKAVSAGRGYLDLHKARVPTRVRLIFGDSHNALLLENARAIYTVSSQLGFEALLFDKPVRTFGMPFYAGWGVTEDSLPVPHRRSSIALEDLVYAAFIEYSRYCHPETRQGCEAEEILDWLALQQRMRTRFPLKVYAAGFSFRKRRFVRKFLAGSSVRFLRHPKKAPPNAPLIIWGKSEQSSAMHSTRDSATKPGRPVIRLEDGFLRSVGLGAALVEPLSWVADSRSIYYDATLPSELEHLLQTIDFSPDLLARASRLRQTIVAKRLTKYNVGKEAWQRPPNTKKLILVPGQVETDGSIRYGAVNIRTNLDLLQSVRGANPDAYIVYKPHPDVLARLRSSGKAEERAQQWCDEQVGDVLIGPLLSEVDEVHVLTSLTGFEALLRNKKVTCYGQPFYAGWGLTKDIAPVARRTRKILLDMLVAATLIVYPTYVSRTTGCFTTPERVIEELQQWRLQSPLSRSRRPESLIWCLLHAFLKRRNAVATQ